jgi:hypothetical protein
MWAGLTHPRPGHALGCSLPHSRVAATAYYHSVRVLHRCGAASPADVADAVRRRHHAIHGAVAAQVVPSRDA